MFLSKISEPRATVYARTPPIWTWLLAGACLCHAAAYAQPQPDVVAEKATDDIAKKRAERQRFQAQTLITAVPASWAFKVGDTPRIVWRDVQTIRELGLDPTLQVRWFNSQLAEQPAPNAPGRWLAWVEGHGPHATPFRRSLTFFALPQNLSGNYSPDLTISFPNFPGPDAPAIIREHQAEITRQLSSSILGRVLDSEDGAILLAGLYEAQPLGRPARSIESVLVENDAIHLALKRKLLGLESRSQPLDPPRRRTTAATVLREGTLAEAGMKADAKARIDAVCQAWAEDSREPFVTLVARHGVVVTHEVFGAALREKPVQRTDRFWVASITKTVTALLFSRFVDQGRVQWDDPLSVVFPDFPQNDPHVPTFRQCLNHTSGLAQAGDVGDIRQPHFENRLLNGIDANEPGTQYAYSGTGFEVAAKAMELLAGQTAVRLYHTGLFEPLGFVDIPLGNASSDGEFTAWELGVLAQWVCNEGSYGDREFISPRTFGQLLPQPLEVPDRGSVADEGLGLHWILLPKPGAPANSRKPEDLLLSPTSVGHGSASSCIFIIDPERELIITQVRRTGGIRNGEWREKMFQAIVESME